jgi:3-oxoadipate enol-lactonase
MANTVTLHYSEAGQGTPVVLLHGFPLTGAIWHEQQRQLSDQCRVIVPDLRGHGQSPVPSGVYDMELMAGDVLALLDSLGIKQAIILGHSMGGYVTLALWKLAPERFRALGLVASQAGADSDEGRQARYKLAEKVGAEGSQVVAEAMIPKLFAPPLAAKGPILEQVRQLILHTQPVGIVGTLKGMAVRPDSMGILPKVSVPVLLLMGDQDQIIPPAKAEAMAAVLPRVTHKIVENAGHMPMLEQPQATTAAIRDFVTACGT